MDQVYRWNRWYEGLPEDWRFQVILGPLIVIGFINMLMTVAFGFPFALLVLLGIAAVVAMRVPYVLGWLKTSEAAPDGRPGATTVELHDVDWLHDLNLWYDNLPPERQFWVIPIVLLAAGAINMWLTIDGRFPFGLLFLIVLLIVLALRGPYVAGWVKPPRRQVPQELAGAAPQAAIETASQPRLTASGAEAPMAVRQPEAVTVHQPEAAAMHEPEAVAVHEPEAVAVHEPEAVAVHEPEPSVEDEQETDHRADDDRA